MREERRRSPVKTEGESTPPSHIPRVREPRCPSPRAQPRRARKYGRADDGYRARHARILPQSHRTPRIEETPMRRILLALCTGEISSPSSITLVNATESGPTDAVVKP